MNETTPKRHVVAAVLTVAGGLGLLVLGWWIVGFEYQGEWSRFADGAWWASEAVKAVGLLAFGKVGFKIALAGVAVAAAVGAKVVGKRRHDLS